MLDVLAFGETMVELSLAGTDARIGVAGDTFNMAVYLKRSAPDLTVGCATRLGEDPLSERILEAMADEDLDVSNVRRGQGLPGLYAITTDDTGERSFHYWRSEAAARQVLAPDGIPLQDLAATRLFYFSAISLAILPEPDRARLLDWLETARHQGLTVAFDSNYRPRLWPNRGTAQRDIARAWRLTDIGLPSLDDEIALFDDADDAAVATRLANWGVTSGAMKRGPDGPLSLTTGVAPPDCRPADKVIDSTAAGDSFNGGYLAARLRGADDVTALQMGHALAARVVGHRGAILPKDT